MSSPKKATALILAGGVALSSAAYGIGTATGDGSASAARDGDSQNGSQNGSRDWGPPGDPGAGFDDLADKLGVEASELEDALRDYHDQQRNEGRNAFAAALADALGKQADEVQSALDSLDDKRKARFAARLAKELGVDADKVATALEELEQDRPDGPGDFAADLAEKLGVEAAAVEDAFEALRPRGPWRNHDRKHAVGLRELASALDVTRAELRKALREVRSGADEAWEEKHDGLVKFLAERFNLSEDKVRDALPDFAGRGGPGGPGRGDHGPGGMGGPGPGPGGPGGPGGFGPF